MTLRNSVAALIGWMALSAPVEPQQVPRMIRDAGPPHRLAWVSAEALAEVAPADLRGINTPMRRALEVEAHRGLEKAGSPAIQDLAGTACDQPSFVSHLVRTNCPARNLRDLLDYSHSIVEATIEAAEPGFYGEYPASLLVVKVRQWIRRPPDAEKSQYLFISTMAAHFMVGTQRLCGFPKMRSLRPGEVIVVFLDDSPRDKEGLFFAPPEEQVFLLSAHEERLVPTGSKSSDAAQLRLQELERLAELIPPTKDHSNCWDGNPGAMQ